MEKEEKGTQNKDRKIDRMGVQSHLIPHDPLLIRRKKHFYRLHLLKAPLPLPRA
jgi:hypothetical protein